MKKSNVFLKNEGSYHRGILTLIASPLATSLPNLIIAWWELIGGGIAGLPHLPHHSSLFLTRIDEW